MVNLSLMLLFCLALAVFAVQNTATVPIHFLLWTSQSFSLAMLVILSAAIGAALAFLLSIPTHLRRRSKLKARERELRELRDAAGKH